ncbi:hypothetical protein Pmar_PMAR006550 [Perkinsus marinus ATCC 50983]|uniref:Uncharacterized protein n=1 Tax=Perkinsus marinus (strain ATCC 50983 / TXsc) TaxID=423536 RepID=C5LTR6_PERM5|nr:hypothetical protein Pmar_PMAR006550 [Perkinsus marinus ATCC 50983]EEQ99878.1 hypothetical protein Pmar_PMAR006550 [Perkinsus marinus ATCC 50983]|eukprot:XP_002767161.1 hypothetical protein Pmar_PMAR006550 [Perkinsus marinus ATCC 50983]
MDVDTVVEADAALEEEQPDSQKVPAQNAETDGDKTVSNHEIFRRHTEEWKKMKVQVADLKRQRMRLPKKGNKDKKKLISQEIKKLVADLREKHDRELEEAGIVSGSVKYKRMDIDIDVNDEDSI